MFSVAFAAIKSLIQGQNLFDQNLETFVFLLPVVNQTLHLEHNMNQTQQEVHFPGNFNCSVGLIVT